MSDSNQKASPRGEAFRNSILWYEFIGTLKNADKKCR